MAGWLRAPDVEWYALFNCPSCGAQTAVEGVVVRRLVVLYVLPIPLWRDWYFRCHSCRNAWKVEKQAWRKMSQRAFTPDQFVAEARDAAEAKRSQTPSHLGGLVSDYERKGWRFLANSETTVDFWRDKGRGVERLRVSVNSDGQLIKEEKWAELS